MIFRQRTLLVIAAGVALFTAPRLSAEGSNNPLMGVAAIVGAASPMVVAGIQAGADKAIAATEAKTTLYNTQAKIKTDAYLGSLNALVSLSMSFATERMNTVNQAFASFREGMVNALTLDLQNKDYNLKSRELTQSAYVQKKGIELEEKKMALGVSKSEAELNASVTAKGYGSGAKSQDSGSSLSVTSHLTSLGNRLVQSAAKPNPVANSVYRGIRSGTRYLEINDGEGDVSSSQPSRVSDLLAFHARSTESSSSTGRHRSGPSRPSVGGRPIDYRSIR